MKPGTSKKKGNSFENKILKELRKIDKKSFKCMGSGNSDHDKGDIVFLNYLIECKHRKNITKGYLKKIWNKVCTEANNRDLTPIVIFRRNREPIMVMRMNNNLNFEFLYFESWLGWENHDGK